MTPSATTPSRWSPGVSAAAGAGPSSCSACPSKGRGGRTAPGAGVRGRAGRRATFGDRAHLQAGPPPRGQTSIEEVGRLIGLDKVPETLPAVPQAGGLRRSSKETRLLRRLLADLGLAEAITYPFGPERWTDDLGLDGETVRLQNPLSVEGSHLRTTILARATRRRRPQQGLRRRGAALFELGNVFFADPPPDDLREAALRFRMTGETGGQERTSGLMGVREENRIGVVLAGTVRPAGWNVPEVRSRFLRGQGPGRAARARRPFRPRGETVSASRALRHGAGRRERGRMGRGAASRGRGEVRSRRLAGRGSGVGPSPLPAGPGAPVRAFRQRARRCQGPGRPRRGAATCRRDARADSRTRQAPC